MPTVMRTLFTPEDIIRKSLIPRFSFLILILLFAFLNKQCSRQPAPCATHNHP